MTIFDTSPTLARALAAQNYADPTPVQAAVLNPDVAGRDIIVSAQTGSGKTVAYALAMAPIMLNDEGAITAMVSPAALIIAPTRELALQVERELLWLYQFTGARIVSCVGGMDPGRERRKLSGGAHIVVGTPGRLRDHIERGALDVTGLRALVLDEADEMLDLGFREDIEFILQATPEERRTLLFSATIPRPIAALAQRYQRNALRIEVTSDERGHADIEYRAIRVAHKEHEHAVVNLLRFYEAPTALVFCNTREAVRHMHATLQERGFSSVLLSGELSQHERNQSLQALRDGRARVCIATDVAARGIDVPNLALVIHAELPNDAETLQHRSGRTGRAGKKGVSAMIVPAARHRKAHLLLRDANLKAEWSGPPEAEEIRKLDRQRLLQDPVLNRQPDDEDLAMARVLLAERGAEEICAALVHIYRAKLPAIEEVSDPGEGPTVREYRERRETRDGGGDFGARDSKPRRGKSDGESRPHKGHGIPGGVWFRLDIGRKKNADPRWLMPMLCRKGEITRQDVGAIRIFEHETKVEIAGAVADQFAINIRKPGGENIRVDREDGAGGGEESRPHQARAVTTRSQEPRHRETRPNDRPAQDFAPRDRNEFTPREKPRDSETGLTGNAADRRAARRLAEGKAKAGGDVNAASAAMLESPAPGARTEEKTAPPRRDFERKPEFRKPGGFEGKPRAGRGEERGEPARGFQKRDGAYADKARAGKPHSARPQGAKPQGERPDGGAGKPFSKGPDRKFSKGPDKAAGKPYDKSSGKKPGQKFDKDFTKRQDAKNPDARKPDAKKPDFKKKDARSGAPASRGDRPLSKNAGKKFGSKTS